MYPNNNHHPSVPQPNQYIVVTPVFDPENSRYKCFKIAPPKLGLRSAYVEITLNILMGIVAVVLTLAGHNRLRGEGGLFGSIVPILVAVMLIFGIRRNNSGLIVLYIVMKILAMVWHIICVIIMGLVLHTVILNVRLENYVVEFDSQSTSNESYNDPDGGWNKVFVPILITGFVILLVQLITDPIFLIIGFKCRRFVNDYKNAQYAQSLSTGIVAGGGITPSGYAPSTMTYFTTPGGTTGGVGQLSPAGYPHFPPAPPGYDGGCAVGGISIENPSYAASHGTDKLPSYEDVVKSGSASLIGESEVQSSARQ